VGHEMNDGICLRALAFGAVLLATASCSLLPGPPPGHLTLSNYRFDHAAIQAVVTAAPDCTPVDPSAPPNAFVLPFKGTRVIEAAPSTDICWRRQLASGQWSDWNRAFTASGRYIDSQL
jgi:hypothetical protein